MNPKLRLNITFISIVLHNLGTKCDYDKHEIKHQEKTKLKHRYCGKHSEFNVYPLFIKMTVTLTLKTKNNFKLKAAFSVTDECLIFSPVNSLSRLSEKNFELQSQYYKIVSKYYLTSFLLRVTKLHKISLRFGKSEENNSVIYDGPGTMFKVLSIFGEKSPYITSTFQCLLQFLFTYFIESYSKHFRVHIVPHFKKVDKKHRPDKEMLLNMPFNNCPHNICILHLEGTRGYQINFTVLSVIASGSESSTCLFNGITIGELSNHFSTIVVFCPHFGAPTNILMRSFYTKNHDLWIILYWYEGYSTISATITAITTKCKGVKFDVYYYNSCKMCNGYLERVYHSIFFSWRTSRVSLEKECVVLMVKDWEGLDTYKTGTWFKGTCGIRINSDKFEISRVQARLHGGSRVRALLPKDVSSEKKSSTFGTEISIRGIQNVMYFFTLAK